MGVFDKLGTLTGIPRILQCATSNQGDVYYLKPYSVASLVLATKCAEQSRQR
jgi:hypothetical protein